MQAPFAAAMRYCFANGPAFADDDHGVRPVELVYSGHAWTPPWTRRADQSEYHVRADGWWVLRPPVNRDHREAPLRGRIPLARPLLDGVNTWYGLARNAYYEFPIDQGYREDYFEEGDDPQAPPQPVALFVEAEVPWRWIESALREFEYAYLDEPRFPKWIVDVVAADPAPEGKRSLPLLLLLDRRLVHDREFGRIERLTIDRQESVRDAPVEYGFDGRFELDAEPIAQRVGELWEAGGTVELVLDHELTWAEVVDFLDWTWTGSEDDERICRIVLPLR